MPRINPTPRCHKCKRELPREAFDSLYDKHGRKKCLHLRCRECRAASPQRGFATPDMPLRARLLTRVVVDACGCWLWQGRRTRKGYGQYTYRKGHSQFAHRLMYEATYGPIPDGLNVCHRCDVPHCINPEHLFLGSQQDNVLDMHRKGRGNPVLGEQHQNAKLTEIQVQEIRRRYQDGGTTHNALAREYHVARSTITAVLRRKHWRHVE